MLKNIIRFKIFLMLLVVSNLSAHNNCNVTYIANEGFLIETQNKKVLIDALFEYSKSSSIESPLKSSIYKMIEGVSPFNDIDIVFITHKHADHFNKDMVINFLRKNKKVKVVCHKQVEEILKESGEYKNFKNNIVAVTPEKLKKLEISVNGVDVKVLNLEHSHYNITDPVTGEKTNKHKNIKNLGFVFNLDGIKIFHCGDTNPQNEEEYIKYNLQNEKIDLAFLERMFFTYGEYAFEFIKNYINPKEIILMHVNPNNRNQLINYLKSHSEFKIFTKRLESKSYKFLSD